MASKTNTLKEPNKVNDNSILIGEPDLLCKILTLLCFGVCFTLLTVYTYYPKSVDNNSSVITNNTTNFSNELDICLSLIIINWLYVGLYIYLMMYLYI
jgi:hypothetical protein